MRRAGWLVAAGLAVGLAAAEAIARAMPRYRLEAFRHDFGPPLAGLPAYRPHPVLGYVHEPLSVTGMNSTTNRLGLVNPDFPLAKAPGTKRLLVLGDSIVEYGVLTAQLQRLLDAEGGPHRWEVWNAAVGGYNAAQYSRVLEEKGEVYDPDFLLIGFCLNDFEYDVPVFHRKADGTVEVYSWVPERDALRQAYYDVRPAARRLLFPWLLRRSALYRAALTAMHMPHRRAVAGSRRRYEMGRVHVGRIRSWAQRRGIPVAAVVFPYLLEPEKLPAGWKEERSGMEQVLGELSLPWLDLSPALPGAPARWRLHPRDHIHPSAEGNRRAALATYEFIARLGWTGRRAAARRGT